MLLFTQSHCSISLLHTIALFSFPTYAPYHYSIHVLYAITPHHYSTLLLYTVTLFLAPLTFEQMGAIITSNNQQGGV